MSKITDVLTAMQQAGGNKERLTAGWLELSTKHQGLHDALHAVFKRKPTTQRLGLWLSKNVGAQHGELELIGRHSTHSKAWRYAVLQNADKAALERAAAETQAKRIARQEEAAAIAARKQERETRGKPGLAITVQAPPSPAPVEPKPEPRPEPHRDYIVTGVSSDGRVKREYLPPPPKAAETPESRVRVNVTPETASDARLPPWVREGRQPTKQELTAQHEGRRTGVAVTEFGVTRIVGQPVTGFSDPGGIVRQNMNRLVVSDENLDGWRYDGSPDWPRRL